MGKYGNVKLSYQNRFGSVVLKVVESHEIKGLSFAYIENNHPQCILNLDDAEKISLITDGRIKFGLHAIGEGDNFKVGENVYAMFYTDISTVEIIQVISIHFDDTIDHTDAIEKAVSQQTRVVNAARTFLSGVSNPKKGAQ